MFKKCLKCGRIFAMKKVEKKLVKEEQTQILETLTEPNLRGEIHIKSERFVPGKVKVYETIYKCRFCGEQKSRLTQKRRKA
ncbi:MAG: hypothetical protein IJE62_09010 [Clostridia bacterium]|nr:hypothetical protein [Clostridia bacterium]